MTFHRDVSCLCNIHSILLPQLNKILIFSGAAPGLGIQWEQVYENSSLPCFPCIFATRVTMSLCYS